MLALVNCHVIQELFSVCAAVLGIQLWGGSKSRHLVVYYFSTTALPIVTIFVTVLIFELPIRQ